MKLIRKLLVKILGIEGFIKFVSKVYLQMVSKGFLKSKYPELFYLKQIVKQGDTCIDIGANLGYYSTLLSRLCGNEGKVYAVEPIPMFAAIWKKNVRMSKVNNLHMYPYALGNEDKTVQMGIPERDGVLHHGMTKITSTAEEKYVKFFDVEMKVPNKLFANLDKLDFIKCDVEGFEHIVFANMTEIIEKFKPLIQTELGGQENRKKVIDLLESLNYTTKILKDGELISVDKQEINTIAQDFYFEINR